MTKVEPDPGFFGGGVTDFIRDRIKSVRRVTGRAGLGATVPTSRRVSAVSGWGSVAVGPLRALEGSRTALGRLAVSVPGAGFGRAYGAANALKGEARRLEMKRRASGTR